MSRVIRGESTTPPPTSLTSTPRARALWTVVIGLGAAVGLIGAAELSLSWFGLQFTEREVFLEAVNRHFAGVLTPTMGLGAVAVGLMGRGSRRFARSMAWLFGLIATAHVALLVTYMALTPSDLPARIAMWETMLRGVTYAAAYGWLAYYLWAQTRVFAWPTRP